MTYERFEDLPVWRASIDLGVQVYGLTANPVFKGNGSLRDQMERAAVSVANNIAEGFERGTTQELLSFLYIARGSAGEVRSMLCFLERLAEQGERGAGPGERLAEQGERGAGPGEAGLPPARRNFACDRFAGLEDLKSQISNLKSLAESVSRQLRGWANSLQNSEITGQRHLTEKSGRVFRAKREREEFLEHLRQIREGKEAGR
jgi:four helix bundle protein